MTARFLGLTWDHPRGYNALAAAAGTVAPAGLIHWEKQPLEGFESHPIGELAARYDLLVLDHPHLGEAVSIDCLQPLESLFAPDDLAAWTRGSIGPAMASYLWQGHHWALPLDVATQVLACREDLIGAPPESWDAVLALSERAPVALSVAGPHAAVTFQSLCIALGEEPGGEGYVSDAVGAEALAIMTTLAKRAPVGTAGLNPMGLLGAMAETDAIGCVPLVFGYVTYATAGPGRHRVRFADAPTGSAGRRGSVIGGTGLALTRRTRPDAELLEHLRWLLGPAAQCGFIPDHDGQPSLRRAWLDPAVNARSGDFYRATVATTDGSWVRPRHDGAIAFQNAAASLVRGALAGADPIGTLSSLRSAWRRSCQNPREAETVR